MKHDARFPYRGTLAEAEKARSNSSFGGFKWGTYYSNKLEMLLKMPYLVQAVLSNKISCIEAKNALQSAYANSSTAEKVQLREMQEQLQNITNLH